MSSCPLCDVGHNPTHYVFLPLVDPKTGVPTGQHVKLSQATYDKILQQTQSGVSK